MDTELKEAILDALTELEWNDECSIRWGYSGRAMYGKECVGIVADDVDAVVERVGELAVMNLMNEDEDAVYEFIRTARYDQMGLSEIAYWPTLQATDDEASYWVEDVR